MRREMSLVFLNEASFLARSCSFYRALSSTLSILWICLLPEKTKYIAQLKSELEQCEACNGDLNKQIEFLKSAVEASDECVVKVNQECLILRKARPIIGLNLHPSQVLISRISSFVSSSVPS